MKREQIGLITFTVRRRGETYCIVKIYQDGTFFRSGNGTKPCGAFSALCQSGKKELFEKTLRVSDPSLYAQGWVDDGQHPSDISTEYLLQFYNKTDLIIENYEQDISPGGGLRIVSDSSQLRKHPLLRQLKEVGVKMLELTDEMYTDAVISHVFDVKPEHREFSFMIQGPGNFAGKSAVLENHIRELRENDKLGSIMRYAKSQTYSDSANLTFRLHEDIYNPDKVIMKPWVGEVMQAGLISDQIFANHISRPNYARGLGMVSSDELPMGIVLPIFIIIFLLLLLGYLALML